MANCPMCGYLWNAKKCKTCGWKETPRKRRKITRTLETQIRLHALDLIMRGWVIGYHEDQPRRR